jgi:hypothetical protein
MTSELNRNDIVARWHELQRQIERRELKGATVAELQPLRDERSKLREAYQACLAVLGLSRCPFTNAVMKHSIDTVGLDGMWWAYHNAARKVEREVPRTFFSLQGAMHLVPPFEVTPFLVKPGPGVPFVLPRLLEDPEIRAVVSSVEVGRHRAFPIAYFAQSDLKLQRPNAWGRNGYNVLDDKGAYLWGKHVEDPAGYDYELAPWIARGKLSWIAPGDTELTLRSTVDGCPYLGLEGARAPQHLEDGTYWT